MRQCEKITPDRIAGDGQQRLKHERAQPDDLAVQETNHEPKEGESAGREDEEAERDPMVLINPEILSSSDEGVVREEGCLSIPDYFAEVERPDAVRVGFIDRDGKSQEIEATGVLATCLQHEIDHLNGKLFIDYLSKLKRDMVIRRFTKQAKLSPKPAVL